MWTSITMCMVFMCIFDMEAEEEEEEEATL